MMLLKSVIGLGYGIRASSDCLGQDFASNIGGLDVTVRFPTIAPSPGKTSRQRLLAPAEYDYIQNGLPLKLWNYPTADPADEVDWGFVTPTAKSLAGSTGHPVARVNSALLLVSVPNGVEPTSVAYEVNDARNSWWGLLDEWIWCLSEQSVSQEPKLASPLDPPLSFWSPTDRRRVQNGSVVASDSITLVKAPFALSRLGLQSCLHRSGKNKLPPKCWLSLRRAKHAAMQDNRRVALSEAGAALEEGLDDWLTKGNADLVGSERNYLAKENDSLAKKTKFAQNHRSCNSLDGADELREARNRAIHQGIIPSNATTLAHVQTAETALLALYPDMKQAREVSIVADSRMIFEVPFRRQDALND